MKVFKFGGGILTSGESIRKIPQIIGMFPDEPLLIVVSAFGKTTNALEDLILSVYRRDGHHEEFLKQIKQYHDEICNDLFKSIDNPVYGKLGILWDELERKAISLDSANFSFYYDQLIVFGEMISSTIVSQYLTDAGLKNAWLDVRQVLITNSDFQDAAVDWDRSLTHAEQFISPLLRDENEARPLVVIQGFIGSDKAGNSTSLGREGSDYTASIFANLLDASEVITWKDVPGILNADPKYFSRTIKLDSISYAEATELAYYGAKVIHPKTVKPLQNKGIPLQVRSFADPNLPGTLIHAGSDTGKTVPNFILKFDQVLVSVSTRDLSFIDEHVFKEVFALLSRFSIHINIIQNSALTLSFCIDKHPDFNNLLNGLKEKFSVRYNEGLELITIRHFNEKAAENVLEGKSILLEQHNRTVVQYVVK